MLHNVCYVFEGRFHAQYDWTPGVLIRRVESTLDLDAFEKYSDTPPISIAILLQKYALLVQEAAQYLPKGCSRKMPPSFPSF